jgi:hypothetical protein
MPGSNKGIAAGTNLNFLGLYDENNLLTGGTPTPPAAGVATGNPFAHIYGVKEAAPTVGTPDEVVITGDDVRLGSFDFDSIEGRAFDITMAAFNLQQQAMLLGVNVETIGEMKVSPYDIIDRVELNACLILQGRTKKQDIGLKGLKAYSGVFIPLCTIVPLGRDGFTERGAAAWRWHVTPQVASNHIWGVTLAEASAGTSGATYIAFTSDFPIHMQVIEGNASQTSWTVQQRPISVAKSPVYFNRSLGSTATVTPASKAIVTNAGSGRGVIVYEFDQFVEAA